MSKNLSDIFPPTEIGGGGGGIEEAPKTGKLHGRKDGAWEEFDPGRLETGNKDGEILTWDTATAKWVDNDTVIVKGGNVAIGSDNPNAYSNYSGLTVAGGDGSNLTLRKGTTVVGDIYTVRGTNDLGIVAPQSDGRIVFNTAGYAETSPAATITSSGNFGINNAFPSAMLEVGDGTALSQMLISSAGTHTLMGPSGGNFDGLPSDSVAVFLETGGYPAVFGTNTAKSAYIATNGKRQVTVDASGRVGIGTDSPGQHWTRALSINTATNGGVEFLKNDVRQGSIGLQGDGRINTVAFGSNPITFDTGNEERVRIDDQGRVGIGSDSPSASLEIDTASADIKLTSRSNLGEMHLFQGHNSYIESNRSLRIGSGGMADTLVVHQNGSVGVGGIPARSSKEIEEEADATLRNWDSKDKKPTKAELVKQLTERNIGGGLAKLQVAGDGYFTGGVNAGGIVNAEGFGNPNGSGFLYHNGTPVLAWDSSQIYPMTSSGLNVGMSSNPFKDGHFSGTIYGKVADVPDHVKAITPTQIANWDAGTGGGGGGATTDGRISDDQILHWDQAYSWGNHADANYQPAGSYLTPSSLNGYATESWVQGQGYITSASLSGYATEPWVSANYQVKGSYLTPTDISDMATETWVAANYQPAGSYLTSADLSGYATQSWVQGQNYLTSASLSGYATESWVTSNYQAKGNYLTSADLNGYATESWVSTNYQAKGNYALVGDSYTKADSDNRYQTKGNYETAGTAYTKAESDAKYELKGAGGLPAGDWYCSGTIRAAGNIVAYYTSDERLKDDIAPMPIGLIDGIAPATFKWKDSGKSSGGVIAQQLQKAGLGDWVNEAPNGDLGVDYNALIGVLLAEVQDLKARVKELEG